MKHVAYIHGLNSSKRSFSYITQKLPEHSHVLIEYDSHQPLAVSIDKVKKQLPKGELVLVGHSLGGVISALIAAEDPDIKRLVAISAPFKGSRAAVTLRWLPGSPAVITDIMPRSPLLSAVANLKLTIPTLSIISTGGHMPTSPEPNDSVVAISSQMGLKFGRKVEVKANHFEVLMHEKTASLLNDFIFKEEGLLDENHLTPGP